jgi:preprotein translocase subunit SecE
MSRAVRRQKTAAPKERSGRQTASPFGSRTAQPTRGQRPVAATRKRRISQPKWLEDIVSELKKVTWPSRDETVYLSTVVIIVAITVGIILGSVDIFFNWAIDKLLLR